MAVYPAFIGSSDTSQSPISDAQELINFYLERTEVEGSTSRAWLYPTPGYEAFGQVAQVGGRAMFAMGLAGNPLLDGRCFGVIGSVLYEFLSDGSETVRGSVAIDSNPATISTNGDGGLQLLITSGDNAYCYDLSSNTLTTEVTGGATSGGVLYGYGVLFDQATSTIRISDLFDLTAWDPTQFAQRTIGSDPWRAMLVNPYGQIVLPGSQTGEFWYNSGAFPFPFAPDPSGLIEEGIAAPFSIKQAGKSAVWLATNKNGGYQVVRAQGFTPQRISTHAMEYQISRYTRVDDALGETYEDQGHVFYLLTFPTADVTWCYDFTTGAWHKRLTWIQEDNAYESMHPVFHAFAFNKHLMADRTSNYVYQMDIDFPNDVEDRVIRRMRRAPMIHNQNERVYQSSFELLCETGLGNAEDPGQDPIVMYRKSKDGGKTWGNERHASAGAGGEYGKRVEILRNGQARKGVIEITVSDPVINWRLTEAYTKVQRSTESRQVA